MKLSPVDVAQIRGYVLDLPPLDTKGLGGSNADEFAYVKARIYYDGSVRVLLLKRGPDADLGPETVGTLNYPGIRGGLRSRVRNAWARLDEAAPAMAKHIILADKRKA